MQMTVKKKIGKRSYTFLVEGTNLHEVVIEANKLSFGDMEGCGLCHSDNLILTAHVAQAKYKYTEIRCLDCKGTLTFGQKKEDPNTFYLRRNDDKSLAWEQYKANGKPKEAMEEKPPDDIPPGDDMPF